MKTCIAILREDTGMTQKELAKKSGVNLRTIRAYEQGTKDINKASATTVYKLAKALGETMENICEFVEED